MQEYLHSEKIYKIIGACLEVPGKLGSGYLEPIYQEALESEFELRQIPYEREKSLTVHYKGRHLDKKYEVDFICYDSVLVELKAVNEICSVHEAQLLNYLKTTSIRVGLLINFGTSSLETKRIIL